MQAEILKLMLKLKLHVQIFNNFIISRKVSSEFKMISNFVKLKIDAQNTTKRIKIKTSVKIEIR